MNEFMMRKDIQIRQFEAKDMSEVIELQDISTYKPKHEELSELAIRFIKQGMPIHVLLSQVKRSLDLDQFFHQQDSWRPSRHN